MSEIDPLKDLVILGQTAIGVFTNGMHVNPNPHGISEVANVNGIVFAVSLLIHKGNSPE